MDEALRHARFARFAMHRLIPVARRPLSVSTNQTAGFLYVLKGIDGLHTTTRDTHLVQDSTMIQTPEPIFPRLAGVAQVNPTMRRHAAHSLNTSRCKAKVCITSLIIKWTTVAETPIVTPISRCVI